MLLTLLAEAASRLDLAIYVLANSFVESAGFSFVAFVS